jgi:hypothetical protein
VRKPSNFPCLLLSLSIWLGVERIGRQTEDDFDTVTAEGLEAVCDRPGGVDEVRSAVKDVRSRDIAIDGAQFFPNQALASESTPY